MTIVDFSLFVVGVLFSLYGVFSAFKCGMVLGIILPELSRINVRTVQRPFILIWRTANLFLLAGLLSAFFLFNNSINQLNRMFLYNLLVALGLLFIQVLAGAWLFRGPEQPVRKWSQWVLMATIFLTPMAFAASAVYLLTGELFFKTLLGWALMAAAIAGLGAVGLLFVTRKATRRVLRGELLYSIWFLILGSVVPLIIENSANNLAQLPIVGLVGISAVGLGIMLLRFAGIKFFDQTIKPWHFSILTALVVPILLAWANRPYLIAGRMSLASAYSAGNKSLTVLFLLAITTISMVAVGLFIKSLGGLAKARQ